MAVNALSSVAQVAVMSVTLFLLYRYILRMLGSEQLGIWSMVLATSSVARVADFGLSGSVTKFASQYIARGELQVASALLQTAAVSSAVAVGLVVLVGYPFFAWVLMLLLHGADFELALSVLPFSLFSLLANAIGGVFTAGLDAHQRIDIRNWILMAWLVVFLLLAFAFTPRYGLLGLAYAQSVQSCGIVVFAWFSLRRCLKELPLLPHRWDRTLFKEMIGYGMNFQITSVMQMLYDPTTKALLSKFGGLASVAYFEMANRMVVQLRSFIVSASQVMVPVVSAMKEMHPERIQKLYRDVFKLVFVLSVPCYTLLVAIAPFGSEIWIGKYEQSFIGFAWLLSVAWFANTLSAPAYFASLGIGKIRWNTISHIVMGGLNISLGIPLGYFFGGTGVVVAWGISLAIGSRMIVQWYHREYHIGVLGVLDGPTLLVTAAAVLATIFSLASYFGMRSVASPLMGGILGGAVFVGLILFPMARHPIVRASYTALRTVLTGVSRPS